MKIILLSFALCIITFIHAQTKYTITASGMSFTPNNLTINQGDTVEWNNVSGFHNVNGTQTTFPSNPASFGNGVASNPWTYTFVFNVVGNYAYQCDVHAPNMSGTVFVQVATQITEVNKKNTVKIFPNPVADFFTIDAGQPITSVLMYNITGKLVKTYTQVTNFDVKDLPKGIYFLNIEMGDTKLIKKLIIQ